MPKSRSTRRKKKAASSPAARRFPGRRSPEFFAGQLGGRESEDAVASAQDVMYDAWDAPTRQRRVALARKALAISSLCADAYVLLARETARTVDETIDLYRKGVEAGARALGKAAFMEDAGHFWGILETRPYMRARHGLAQVLWAKGQRDEAVDHYRDMLRLNPNDNQGIRYLLLDCLLELGRDTDAAKLLRQYRKDGAAAWAYSEALLSFRRDGGGEASRGALGRAIKANAHVPDYLCGRKKLPRELPALIGMGDEDEAVAYVHGAQAAWAAAPGATEWLAARVCAAASEQPPAKTT